MAEKTSPLLTLVKRLRSFSPPSITALLSKYGDIEEYQEFVMLIREYLPEYEAEILREPSQSAQISEFASHFRDRYFPLSYHIEEAAFNDISYSDLTRGIPVEVRGWSYDDYDMLSSDARPGIQLLAYLIESPYANGERASLAEACAEHVPVDMLRRIPEGGIKYDLIPGLFDDSPYRPIVMLARWLYQDSGNFFLDTDYEMLSYNMFEPAWDRGTVEGLTHDWQEADRYDAEISDFCEWLEGDIKDRFQEILDFIAERG